MHVDTICPGCQRKLRVPAEHAGQTARCPICHTVYAVPDPSAALESSEPQDSWRMATPEGQEYGPVSRTVLDSWVAEGRVTEDCRLLCESDRVWRSADEIYPVLRPAPVGLPTPLWHHSPDQNSEDVSSIAMPIAGRGYVINSNRGGIVLSLGILSWALCFPIFGVLAWVMGSNDLNEMRQGTMDPRGHVLTEAGRMIGMLHALLSLAAFVIAVFLVLFWGFLP